MKQRSIFDIARRRTRSSLSSATSSSWATFSSVMFLHSGISVLLLAVFAAQARAILPTHYQEGLNAPPPPRVISEAEKSQLAAASDARKRLRVSLELSAARLTRAEEFTAQGRFADASIELGSYEAIAEDAFAYLRAQGAVNNRLRDLFKRFEQTLRSQTPRLEAIRRTTSSDYAVHVGTTIKTAKTIRTKSLETFFGEGTMREAEPDETPPDDSSSRSVPPARD